MEFTGERMIPEVNRDDLIYLQHISRYLFALQFVKDKKVLDVASGTGYGTKLIAEHGAKDVFGVDIDLLSIKYSIDKFFHKRSHFIVGDALYLPFKDNSFEVIIAFETIEHVDNPERFLKEISRILISKGIFLCSTPNTDVLPEDNPFHKIKFTYKSFKEFINRFFPQYTLVYQNSMLAETFLVDTTISKQKETEQFMAQNHLLFRQPSNNSQFLIAIAKKDEEIDENSITQMITLKENLIFDKTIKGLINQIKELEAKLALTKARKKKTSFISRLLK
ncbi:MAG: class I SAM-dependent methyltransferase [Deltaproteobacteria bacterium]|nr:class I SAM-dependent methyltransferase [Deltaproteobacteria bacterium]